MTTQAGAPAGAPARATAMEATAAEVEGPEATRAAPPGPPVPVTTAGAAQKVEASEPLQTPIGAPWHRERRGLRPQDPWGACTLLLQRGPRAREDLEGRCPADKEELGSAASRGSLPPPSALPPCPGNKEPFRTQGSPCPPSCLMPAYQAGDLSSVDPGTSLKVPILGASPTHSAGPSDPLCH